MFLASDAKRQLTRNLMSLHPDEFAHAATALAADGWNVVSDFLAPAATLALSRECARLHAEHQLQPARIGARRTTHALRGDRTQWFEPDALTAPQQTFAARTEALRISLSRQLLLGLVDSESHYAVYAVGAGYARHLDCLHDDDARVLSGVFYLNANWQNADGGALRLYLADGSQRDIYPRAGTLLLFLSARFEHEVLLARRTRMSIACWWRQRKA